MQRFLTGLQAGRPQLCRTTVARTMRSWLWPLYTGKATCHKMCHNVRHEAWPPVQAWSNKSGIVVVRIKGTMALHLITQKSKTKSLTSMVMPFARSRDLLPSVRQPRRSPPHKLACDWVAHLQGRIHQCVQVLMTSLLLLPRRCL